jgi:hypothetical protein
VVCLPNDTGSVSALQAGPDDRVNVRHGTAFSLMSWAAARPFRPRRRFRWVAGGRMASKQKCSTSASATPVQLGIQTGLVCQTEENSAGLWMQQTGKGSQQGIRFTEAAQAWDDETMGRVAERCGKGRWSRISTGDAIGWAVTMRQAWRPLTPSCPY